MRILVTAGPTREFLDPVRFISNRSSGRMGYAIASVAAARGHTVVLVSGPVVLPAPPAVAMIRVVCAADMLKAVEEHVDSCDALIMAAAVADWRPAERSQQKLKKSRTAALLAMEPTPDILLALRPKKGSRIHVGFAAETSDLLAEAARKLEAKGLDLIVANDVSRTDSGFDVDSNQVVLLGADGSSTALPLMPKAAVAGRILDWVEKHAPASAGRFEDRGLSREGPLGALCAGERLTRQIGFVREIDKLKAVCRRTLLMDGSRYENDAEHSWHLAVMAVLLAEYANDAGVDLLRVVKMVLVHDLVEIDAGDTYCYDKEANRERAARERQAAGRIFPLLPDDQAAELRELWEEFEARETSEARFAAALDRIQPLLHNYQNRGIVWQQHGVTSRDVRARNLHVGEGSAALWDYAARLIQDAVARGYLAP
jgi:putative hydrolases of HD superfamily